MRLIKHTPMLTKIITIVLEVQAAVVACSALLPLAAEGLGSPSDSDHPPKSKKCQQASK